MRGGASSLPGMITATDVVYHVLLILMWSSATFLFGTIATSEADFQTMIQIVGCPAVGSDNSDRTRDAHVAL